MSEVIKLIRSPIDTNCCHCPSKIPFGVWAYYNASTGDAICIDCATKKGWTPKDRVNQIIQKLELQEDIKALRKQRKIESEALLLIQREVDVYQVAEEDRKISGQIVRLLAAVEEYIKSIGSGEEKEAFQKVFEETRNCQELQKEVRALVKDRLLLFNKRRRKQPIQTTAVTEEEVQQVLVKNE